MWQVCTSRVLVDNSDTHIFRRAISLRQRAYQVNSSLNRLHCYINGAVSKCTHISPQTERFLYTRSWLRRTVYLRSKMCLLDRVSVNETGLEDGDSCKWFPCVSCTTLWLSKGFFDCDVYWCFRHHKLMCWCCNTQQCGGWWWLTTELAERRVACYRWCYFIQTGPMLYMNGLNCWPSV